MSFLLAVKMVLILEGGEKITDDPNDAGGLTKWGISKRANPELTDDMIRKLTKEQAIEIYKRKYWLPIKGDDLPANLAIAVFDCAVNMGVSVASMILQSVVGEKRDGIIGQKTIAATKKLDENLLMLMYQSERLLFYSDIKKFNIYGKGWVRRVAYVTNVFCKNKVNEQWNGQKELS